MIFTFMTVKTSIKLIINIIITIAVISFLFWNRIIRERLPLDVKTLEPDLLYNNI